MFVFTLVSPLVFSLSDVVAFLQYRLLNIQQSVLSFQVRYVMVLTLQ